MKRIPLGKQHFSQFKSQNLIYVDKTREIYELVNEPNYYFYSHPRRFGKSLTVDILKNIYLGNKELFDECWIYDKITWKVHPVVHLDFANLDFSTKSLSKAISDKLNEVSLEYEIELFNESPKDKFRELITKLSSLGRVVVLIDEYDKPLTDYITDVDKAEINREILREFFGVLKPLGDKIELVFITGIARFSKVSLFSVLNNLVDITFSAPTLVGITQQELEYYFMPYIKILAEKFDVSIEKILKRFKQMYNGYSWNGQDFVYNPFSVLTALQDKNFGSYWFATGTPKFLIKILKERKVSGQEIEAHFVNDMFFNVFDIEENLDVPPLLFQTGYLTIKKTTYDNQFRKKYLLGYPNQEVKEAFLQSLLEIYTEKKYSTVYTATEYLKTGFLEKNIPAIQKQLNILLSDISYHLFPFEKRKPDEVRKQQEFMAWEGYFQTIVYLVLQYIGINIQCEVTKKEGRLDAIIEVDNYIYVVEFKLNDAKIALQQIKDRNYAHAFQNTNKQIILMGIGFDRVKKEVLPIEWELN
ncbi:MAG: AAA family ATPase [Saprospiraceae bacterium]